MPTEILAPEQQSSNEAEASGQSGSGKEECISGGMPKGLHSLILFKSLTPTLPLKRQQKLYKILIN